MKQDGEGEYRSGRGERVGHKAKAQLLPELFVGSAEKERGGSHA